MFNINNNLWDRVKNYIISRGYAEQAEFYMWNKLLYHDPGNNVTIMSGIPKEYSKSYYDDENKRNIYYKLSMYNISTCVLLVVLKAIGYSGKIFLRLTTDSNYKLLKHCEFNESDIIYTTLPTCYTTIEINYLEALVLLGTPEMLTDYINKLKEFPQKVLTILKYMYEYRHKLNMDIIHNTENKTIFIRFMNEYNKEEDIEL